MSGTLLPGHYSVTMQYQKLVFPVVPLWVLETGQLGYIWEERYMRRFTHLTEDDQTFQRAGQGNVLLVFKLSTLAVGEKDWRALCLPAGNRLRPTSLADDINCLTNANVDGQGLEVLIQRHEEAGMHGGDEVVQEVVGVGSDELFCVHHRGGDGKQPSSRYT